MAYRCKRNSSVECDGCGYCSQQEEETKEECCGTCQHHEFDVEKDDWVCSNIDSDYYADFTGHNNSCSEYDER